MRFSIRNSLAGIACLAFLLAAIVSKSTPLVEIALAAVTLLVPLGLVFAICDSSHRRRPFWIGFFILTASSFAFSVYGDILGGEILGRTCQVVAVTLCGTPEMVTIDPSAVPSQFVAPSTIPSVPQQTAIGQQTRFRPTQTPSNDYIDRLNLLILFVYKVFSLIIGVMGGVLALWIARPRDATELQSGSFGHTDAE